jgi:hypothetical protein
MTPQEKAIQLVDYYMDLSEEQEYDTPRYMSKEMAIKCALIAVNELIKNVSDANSWYWEEVKQEIENI